MGDGAGALAVERGVGVGCRAAASGGLLGATVVSGSGDGNVATVANGVAPGGSSAGVHAATTTARPAASVTRARMRRGAGTIMAVA